MTKENFTKLVLVFTMVMYPLYELCSQNVTVKGRVSINAGDFYYVSVQAKKDSVILQKGYTPLKSRELEELPRFRVMSWQPFQLPWSASLCLFK